MGRMRKILLFLLILFIFQAARGQEGQEEQEKLDALKTFTPQQLEELVKTAPDETKISALIILAGKNMDTDLEKSLPYAREALRLAQKSGKPFYILTSLNTLGNYYHIANRFPEAIRYYLQALEQEPHMRDKNHVASIYTNIGIVYWNLEQYQKAEEYQRRGLELRKKAKSSNIAMAHSLNNLGLVLEGQGKGKEALEYYLQALALNRAAGNQRGMAAALNNIAGVYQKTLKNYPRALGYFRQTITLYEAVGNEWGVANAHLNIGSTYVDMKQYGKARPYLDKALEKAEKLQDQLLLYKIYANFFDIHEAAGDFKTALEFSKKHDQARDMVFNQENSREIEGLVAQHEAEKKEKEIQLLRKTNEIRYSIKIFLGAALVLSLGVIVILYSRFRARKRANRLLQQGEARYRAMFDHAGDAILLMENTTVVDCNGKALEMFGEGLEGVGKTLEGRPPQFHWRHVKKDGTPFEALVSLAPVTIHQRPLTQAIIHDITHRKRLEEERIKSTRLETITLMAGGIAHDFNNLLGVIRGYLDMAQSETEPGSETSLLLARMEKASRSAVELVSEFRTISEIGIAPQEVLFIDDILGEAVGLVLKKSIPAGSRVECNLEIAPDLSPVKGYRAQLRRVFENFAVNALEAVGDNGKIRVSAANIDLSGDEAPPLPVGRYVTVIVADNGEGIPAKNLAKIFDPYFTTRGDSTRSGLGMGLAVAESIVKRHDGVIKVSSELGKGTTFFIYLPVVS